VFFVTLHFCPINIQVTQATTISPIYRPTEYLLALPSQLPSSQLFNIMNAILSRLVLMGITCWLMLFSFESASAQGKSQMVRLAKLQIDVAQLESYKAALKDEIETSVRVEPGVLTLYAVSEKDNPTHIMVFEIYANTDAYKAHVETPHFKKYKNITKEMVKSLELIETVSIALVSKAK